MAKKKKMLTELGERKDEYSESFNKELENIKKTKSEMKNSIAEIKKKILGLNSRLGHTEEFISDLEDRIMKITQSEK